ncbi:hypothetical protein DL96DRAFT_1798159 [Flagelloscypha sp. PMI_526]|nr:hypothetical protein DL96DRAFT_1798159 [Flagelloscypha sp. PMI_526]
MDRARVKLAGSSKLANFFETEEDEFPPQAVAESKLSSFQAGQHRKSKRDKEKEAAEAKKREEEEANARVLDEYRETFEGNEVGNRQRPAAFVAAGSSGAYSSSFHGSRSRAPPSSPPPSSQPKVRGKRAMDSFLEEIKRDQAQREAKFGYQAQGERTSVTSLAAHQSQIGSRDRGDSQTSNVHVANLPPQVTEESLGNFFSKAGAVGSVKIMWPRLDGPKSKGTGLAGFVSFMKRRDAESALRQFDGVEWGGSVLRVGWSKAVPVAHKAKYPSTRREHSRSRSGSRSPTRWRAPSRSRSRSPRRRFGDDPESSRHRHRSRSPRLEEDEDTVTDTFIRAVASEIKSHDADFESQLKEREQSNPKFDFMFRKHHPRHAFYKGLMESDRQLEPEFDDDGYNSVYSTDSAEESEREHIGRTKLGRLARKRFETMLRGMSGRCGDLARCMAFCLEHAEAAPDVADIIVSSLLVSGTPVPRKVARLHLICDILHNSAAPVPSAWKFRQEFQSRLGIVFDHLSVIYHSFPGRMAAGYFKSQIMSVVEVWEDWIVFPPDFTLSLKMRLDGGQLPHEGSDEHEMEIEVPTQEATPAPAASRFKTSSFQLAVDPSTIVDNSGDVDGAPMEIDDALDGEALDGEALDGEDLDGEALDGEALDGEALDGEALDGEGLDGEALDGEPWNGESLDGEALDDEETNRSI